MAACSRLIPTARAREHLRLSKQFFAILRRGSWTRHGALAVGILPNRLPMNRVGIRVRTTVGSAVERNRARRLLWQAYRRLSPTVVTGHDILLTVTHPLPLSLQTIERELGTAFQDAGLITLHLTSRTF